MCSAASSSSAPVPPLQVRGDIEIKIRSALGDPLALMGTGHTAGKFDIMQLLSLNVKGQITPELSISGNLDNRRDGNLQMLDLTLDGDFIKGKFGGLAFRAENPYTSYSSRLRGLEIRAELPTFKAGVTVGRVQGIAAKKTFQGGTAQDSIIYEPAGSYAPAPASGGFKASFEGMEYYILSAPFDPDFMGVWLRYLDFAGAGEEERSLEQTLNLWDLGYLYLADPDGKGVVAAGDSVALTRGQFVAVSSTDDMLALRSELHDILRGHVQSWIRSYNSKNMLTGSDQKRYPFIVGSETEAAFLGSLSSLHAHIVAGLTHDDPEALVNAPSRSYARRRLYDLGQTDIVPGSAVVEVHRGGQYFPAETELPLAYQVMYDSGIVEFHFPASFFDLYDGIRVRYRHTVANGVFHLGISIAQGSEHVYLNDVLLRRDFDYSIDYEYGILTIFAALGPDDVVRVEYEYFKGPFGAPADYKSNFAGASFNWTPNEHLKLGLEVGHYADDPKSAVNAEVVPVMPNSHTVVGLMARYNNKAFTLSGDLALSHDQFPFDDNQKLNAANAVLEIMTAPDSDGLAHLAFAHYDGVSVCAAGTDEFKGYGLGSGLASSTVRDMANSDYTWFFATDGGLTAFSAVPGPAGQSAFDFVGNWNRIYAADGLPSNNLTSVAATPSCVWVGTHDRGVAFADLDDLTFWTAYRKSPVSGLPSDAVNAIAYDPSEGVVLVATEGGLARFDGGHFVTELAGSPVGVVVSGFESAGAGAGAAGGPWRTFAATATGLYARGSTGQWTLIVDDVAVRGAAALAVWNGDLWIATAGGLFVWDGTSVKPVDGTQEYSVTALGIGNGVKYGGQVMWAGCAGRAGDLAVLEVAGADIVHVHDSKDMNIAAEDPRRYIDLPAGDHAATGYAGRVNARYAIGDGAVYGSYEKNNPAFTKLGQASRQSLDAWRLGAQWPVGNWLNLSAEHAQTTVEARSGKPGSSEDGVKRILTVSSRVAGTIDIGPKIDASYTVSKSDDADSEGFEREDHTASVGARYTMFDGRLTLGAGYDNTESENILVPVSSYVQTNLRGDASIKLEGLSATVRYRKPVKTISPGMAGERSTGIDELSLNAQWGKQIGKVNLRATYRQLNRTDIATDRKLDDKRADLKATLPGLKLGMAGAITPSMTLKWERVAPFSGQLRQLMGAQVNLSGAVGKFRTTAGASANRTEYPGLDKTTLDSEVYLTLGGGAIGTFSPQLNMGWKRSTSERPDFGGVSTDALTVTLRGAWVPRQGTSNVASAGYTLSSSIAGQRHSLNLSDTLDVVINSKLTTTAQASVKSTAAAFAGLLGGDGADVRGEVKGGLRYNINNVWSLGLSVGYYGRLAGTDAGGGAGLRSAFTIEAGLRATF